jgi:hypothetical protein
MDWTVIVQAMGADAPAKKRGAYKKTAEQILNCTTLKFPVVSQFEI